MVLIDKQIVIGGGNSSTSRNISIDILKFIAVLFITNSHMNIVGRLADCLLEVL